MMIIIDKLLAVVVHVCILAFVCTYIVNILSSPCVSIEIKAAHTAYIVIAYVYMVSLFMRKF